MRKKKIAGDKEYKSVLLVESVWNEEKKSPRHKTVLNLSKWPEEDINAFPDFVGVTAKKQQNEPEEPKSQNVVRSNN
ncbi:MAG: hypothetical protein GY730_02360 [bacterium]|nr:hypothetical protein [bacterium]